MQKHYDARLAGFRSNMPVVQLLRLVDIDIGFLTKEGAMMEFEANQ